MFSGERSRIARAAGGVTGRPEAEILRDLDAVHVAIVVEENTYDSATAAATAVRIALLTYGTVTLVSTGAVDLVAASRSLALKLRPGERALEIKESPPDVVAGVLRIGHEVASDYHSVTVSNDGWLVRMAAADATGALPIAALPAASLPNALAAIAAASVGMGELWLRVLGVPRSDCKFEWSLFDYATGAIGSLEPGPAMPTNIELHGIQIGAGTVGGAFDYALTTVPVHGALAIVDKDFATTDNYGPHPLVPKGQQLVEKVALAREVLEPALGERLRLFTRREPYSFFKLRIGPELPAPDVVISAVDKVLPRHDLQRLWAPVHIDLAATGGVQCQLIVRTNPGTGLCLIGYFDPGVEPEEKDELATLTGLGAAGFSDPTQPVTDEDVRNAPEAKRARLAQALRDGERWCNVALAATIGAMNTDADFVGSAPHNAILAGTLGVIELVKVRGLGLERDGTFVQWHAVTRQCFEVKTVCQPDCVCAGVGTEVSA